MTMPFVLIILFLFAVLFLYETLTDPSQPRIRQMGLLTWISSGNWPAKVGAGLLILGIGALLRYGLIHLKVAPSLKLGSGFVISAILSALAYLFRNRPERRAIHLSLAGAAAGVAYLTAYSAYDFFGYINEIPALVLLGLVALITGIYAVSSRALSVAILAMTGAFVAPAFALKTPGPLVVYGYYAAVSTLVLIMVTLRHWRGLIHLSFLFTLAGALFFGWTARFCRPENYAVMQPFLLLLTALHIAMPLAQRQKPASIWSGRFDAGYFLALPLASSVLTLCIAPHIRGEGVLGMALLGLLWAAAAIVLKTLKRPEALPHALVAAMLLGAAVLCRMEEVPWLLLGLCLSVALLALAPYLKIQATKQTPIGGLVLLFGFLNFAASIFDSSRGRAFLNDVFAERLAIGALLAVAAWLGRRRKLPPAGAIGWTAAGWTLLMTVLEIQRLFIDFVPQLVFGLLLGAVLASALAVRWRTPHAALSILLVVALAGCGWWAACNTTPTVTLLYLVLSAAFVLFWVTCLICRRAHDFFEAEFVTGMLPLVLLPWARAMAASVSGATGFFVATVIVAALLICGWITRHWLPNDSRMNRDFLPAFFWILSLSLACVTTLHIERSLWAILFECLTLVYLVGFSVVRPRLEQDRSVVFGTVAVIAVSLVLQAMVLRIFGPHRVLTLLDLKTMSLPAVVSLLWVLFGAGLTWWGKRGESRPVWSAGAALLVLAAVKLVLFDFGSLGQLGNILAMIAAGVVFLAVAWLAPPPKKPSRPEGKKTPEAARKGAASEVQKTATANAMPDGAGTAAFSGKTCHAKSQKKYATGRVDALIKFLIFCLVLILLFCAGFYATWKGI